MIIIRKNDEPGQPIPEPSRVILQHMSSLNRSITLSGTTLFLPAIEINPQSSAAEIVRQDYRTADVFRKYGIGYCCGGRWPLDTVCKTHDIGLTALTEELGKATRTLHLSPSLPFETWSIDFLTDYIINIHHHYLLTTIPALGESLRHFADEHTGKYPQYATICQHVANLEEEILPHLRHEEEVIFPYLRQVAHAYQAKDSFAGLLVKTLRKPIARIIDTEHEILAHTLYTFRELTDGYTPPAGACTSHRVILSRLKELDHDLVQHIYLENDILFPRIIRMEKELLGNE